MRNKHTHGPWTAVPHGKNTIIASPTTQVAKVYGVADEENVANAKLIAASPDLADALNAWHEAYVNAVYLGAPDSYAAEHRAACAALAKAGIL